MIKKTLIMSMILCIFITAVVFSVCGEDEIKTIEDNINDVIDENEDLVSRKNVDIEKLTIIKNDRDVELQLKLIDDGKIIKSELIAYMASFSTSEGDYEIAYSNDECYLINPNFEEPQNVQHLGVGTNTLKITFDLSSSDEEISELIAMTYEVSNDGIFADIASSELLVEITAPYEGKVDEKVDFSVAVLGGKSPFSYEWDFGDGTKSNDENPSHYYDTEDIYEVSLTVTDDAGNTEIATTNISITDSSNNNNGNNNGNNNNGNNEDGSSDDSPDSALLIFIVLILVVVIVGVAILIFIIRR